MPDRKGIEILGAVQRQPCDMADALIQDKVSHLVIPPSAVQATRVHVRGKA